VGEARTVTLSWDVFSGELDALETHMRAVGGLVSVPLACEARAALGRSGLGLVLAAARSETVGLDVALLTTVVADDDGWSVGGWMPSPRALGVGDLEKGGMVLAAVRWVGVAAVDLTARWVGTAWQ
jgi:hypothetical protein